MSELSSSRKEKIVAARWVSTFRYEGKMKPGIVGADIDKTAFYGGGVLVRGMRDITRHLADVLSEVYILPIGIAEPGIAIWLFYVTPGLLSSSNSSGLLHVIVVRLYDDKGTWARRHQLI